LQNAGDYFSGIYSIALHHWLTRRCPFYGKSRCNLPQNAFYFAANYSLFCGKMHSILPQNKASICRKMQPRFAAKHNRF
jgi:hypothetical protein